MTFATIATVIPALALLAFSEGKDNPLRFAKAKAEDVFLGGTQSSHDGDYLREY